jgi:putative oxidoreductase
MLRIIRTNPAPFHAVLRIFAGLLFAMHGTQKLFGIPGGKAMGMHGMMGVAGLIELVTGLMIALGFATGIAAFIASGEMAVAYFMAHFPKGFLPIENQGELAVLYCFVFLYLAATGSGIWSVDALLGKGRPQASS